MKLEHCRSCPAQVIWALTENDKLMPVDAKPTVDGNIALIVGDPREAPVARVVLHCEPGELLYTSHFATCPDAKAWKRPKARAG